MNCSSSSSSESGESSYGEPADIATNFEQYEDMDWLECLPERYRRRPKHVKIFKPNPWYPSIERVFVESSSESAHEEEKNFEELDN